MLTLDQDRYRDRDTKGDGMYIQDRCIERVGNNKFTDTKTDDIGTRQIQIAVQTQHGFVRVAVMQ